MEIMSCAAGAWLPFKDPDVEEELRLTLLNTLINADIERGTIHAPSEWEKSQKNLRRILRTANHMVERAAVAWKEWVIWRKTLELDDITNEDIKFEINSGIAFWRGVDKAGRPTLVITGRMMDPLKRQGDLRSFKKFMARIVEDGCRLADEMGQETVSIIYDRRGLEFSHIDPVLHTLTRMTADSLRTHYGNRLGVIYVVHANWFFWGIFMGLIKPFLALISSTSSDKVRLLSNEIGLLPFFEADQIFLLPLDATHSSYEASLPPAIQLSSLIASSLSRVSCVEPLEGSSGASGMTLEDLGLDESKEGFEGAEGRILSPGMRIRTSDKANRTYESDGVRPLDDIKR